MTLAHATNSMRDFIFVGKRSVDVRSIVHPHIFDGNRVIHRKWDDHRLMLSREPRKVP